MARPNISREFTVFGGINLQDPKYKGQKKISIEATRISNIKLSDGGGMGVRPSRVIPHADAYLSAPIHSMTLYEDTSGSDILLLGAGNEILADTNISATPVLAYTQPDGTAHKFESARLGKWATIVDGTNPNLKYDGTNFHKLGISSPVASPTVSELADTGEPSGTYIYAYTYVFNDGAGYESESAKSNSSGEITVSSKKIGVDVVASSDPQVTGIRIYRYSDVSAQWKTIGDGTDPTATVPNTTAMITDNINDSNEAMIVGEYLDIGEPLDTSLAAVQFDGIASHRNRLWGFKNEYLYCTQAYKPDKWYSDISTTFQPILIDPETREGIVAIVSYYNYLVIFTLNKMFLLAGSDESTFTIQQSKFNIGCIARRSPAIGNGYLHWLSAVGVYKWDGENVPVWISEKIDNDFEGQKRGIMDSTDSALSGAVGLFNKKEKQYWLSTAKGSGVFNDRTYIFDVGMYKTYQMRYSPWSIYDFGFTDYAINQRRSIWTNRIASYEGKYYYVAENSTATKDSFATVDTQAFYQSKDWDMGEPRLRKKMKQIFVNCYTTASTITFKTIVDAGRATNSITISSSTSYWNDGTTWNQSGATWGGSSQIPVNRSYPQEIMGNTIAFRIDMQSKGFFHSFEWLYNLCAGVKT